MNMELMIINQDLEVNELHLRNKNNIFSKFEKAVREANVICLCICFYCIIKLLFTLKYHKEIDDKSQQFLIFTTFLYDIIAFTMYVMLHFFTSNLKYSDLSEYDFQINLFKLNHCLISLTIQELVSLYKPINGCIIIYTLQQKSFLKYLVMLKLLNYFTTFLVLNQSNVFFQSSNPLIKFQLIILILIWAVRVIIIIGLIITYVVYSTNNKQIRFQYKEKIIDKILYMIKESQFKEIFLTTQDNKFICVICYQEINETDTIIQLPCNQKHFFHSQCCKQWLLEDLRCPICRNEIDSFNSNRLNLNSK